MFLAFFGAELGVTGQKWQIIALWHGHCFFFVSGRIVCAEKERYEMSRTADIVDVIEAGISAESLRQRAIANNVANLNTPGYRRVDVRFKELFAKAMDSAGGVDLGKVELGTYQPKDTPVKLNGNDVSIEVEIGAMVKNSLRHKALIRVLQKKYDQMNMAITVR